jgi:predicted nucleotidyltransferase
MGARLPYGNGCGGGSAARSTSSGKRFRAEQQNGMPYLLSTCFDRFLESITVTGNAKAAAKTRRDGVTQLLEKRLALLDSFATGSLVRGTGLRNVSDVDVMVVLHYTKHLKDKTPKQALEMVRTALSEYNAKIVKKNGRAVTLYFETWPNVDIVPCKRVGTDDRYVLHIPDMNTGEWILTDPGDHDRAMAATSTRCRQLVRVVKTWNRAHSDYFQSFHIEQVALQLWLDENDTDEGAWPWQLKSFFAKALELTGASDPIFSAYNLDDWTELRIRLERGKALALDAWYAASRGDHESAITKCGVLFGDRFPGYG